MALGFLQTTLEDGSYETCTLPPFTRPDKIYIILPIYYWGESPTAEAAFTIYGRTYVGKLQTDTHVIISGFDRPSLVDAIQSAIERAGWSEVFSCVTSEV